MAGGPKTDIGGNGVDRAEGEDVRANEHAVRSALACPRRNPAAASRTHPASSSGDALR